MFHLAATAVMSMIRVWYIVQTGHFGGQLVYQQEVGTTNTANIVSPADSESFARKAKEAAGE
jgi:hypothetical protein